MSDDPAHSDTETLVEAWPASPSPGRLATHAHDPRLLAFVAML